MMMALVAHSPWAYRWGRLKPGDAGRHNTEFEYCNTTALIAGNNRALHLKQGDQIIIRHRCKQVQTTGTGPAALSHLHPILQFCKTKLSKCLAIL